MNLADVDTATDWTALSPALPDSYESWEAERTLTIQISSELLDQYSQLGGQYYNHLSWDYKVPLVLCGGIVSTLYGYPLANPYYAYFPTAEEIGQIPFVYGTQRSQVTLTFRDTDWVLGIASTSTQGYSVEDASVWLRALTDRIARLDVSSAALAVLTLARRAIGDLATRRDENLRQWAENLSQDVADASD